MCCECPIGTLDHAAAVTQIGAAKPNWIVATGYINDLILIRQQMADQKVTAKVITGINGPQYQEWIDAVGNTWQRRHDRELVPFLGL